MKYILILFAVASLQLGAQPVFQRLDTIKVSNFGTLLKNPWAGGLNFSEWSAVDIDQDGFKDLAVFDKSGEFIRFFKNDGIPGVSSYSHAWQFQAAMPAAVNSWAIFYDYNNDGKQDLFTYSLGYGGIRVYTNNSTPGNLQFTYLKNYLLSDYLDGFPPGNTPVSGVAIPGLSDVDNDGDMDVITFQSSGTIFEFHKNISMELYGHADSLKFEVVDKCWGEAAENNCTSQLNYQFCPAARLYHNIVKKKLDTNSPNATMHAGSCILCIDMDGDTDKDLVLSDISCDSVEYFHNGGTPTNAHMDYTTKVFPNATNSITYKQFPCTYYVDVDNDNVRDLISAPNISASENYKSVWMYKNIGADNAPNFQLVKKNFMQDQMLDFGEGAYPCTLDFDNDGDMDLLVGNFGYYVPVSTYSTKLTLIENTGTPTHPRFNVINSDFGGLSSYNLRNMAPTTGDLDGDGDADLIVGDNNGRMTYFKNIAPIGTNAVYAFESDYSTGILTGMDVGLNAFPQLFDVNNDGLLDLLVGEYEGWLNYYENRGTATNPAFDAVETHFGNVHTVVPGYFEGQSVPAMFRENGVTKVLVGSERGYLYLYGNIDANLGGNFTLIDSVFSGVREGENLAPCLYDFNNDGMLDLVAGNYSGGLAYYKGNSNAIAIEENKAVYTEMILFPNPATNELHVKFNNFNNSKKTIAVYDALGRQLMQTTIEETSYTLQLDELQNGFYILETIATMPNGVVYKSDKSFVKQ